MNKLVYLLCAIATFATNSSSAAEESMKTLSRLLIYNEQNQILAIKVNEGFWVTPAVHNKNKLMMKEALNELAQSYGLSISTPELKGMFFVKYQFPKNNGLYNRLFFRVNKTGGKVTLPKGIAEYRWVNEEDAIDMMSFKHISAPLKKIADTPEKIWAASFRFYLENGVRKSEQTESFYSIN